MDAIVEAIPAENLECFFIYDGSTQKRYEIPSLGKIMNALVSSNVGNIIDTRNSRMLERICCYLQNTDADILFFLNEGEVVNKLYPNYLNNFFEYNR